MKVFSSLCKMMCNHNLLRFFIFITLLFGFINLCTCENVVKKSIDDNRDDTGDVNDEAKDESLDIPVETETANLTCSRRLNSQMHEIKSAPISKFPFMAAMMSHQNEYLCSGSVVANGLVLTTAKCTQQPVSYLLLNATKDKKDETTAMLHVIKTEKFPTFTGGDSLKDVGLIYTERFNSSVASKIKLSNFTSAKNLVDIEVIGYGLNAEVGQPKQLQYIGLELRSPFEGLEVLRAYFDCVETKVPTCFKDTGGPAIFDNELIGVVTVGQDECTKEMSATYAIHKKMAEILPTFAFKAWLDERIKKTEEQEPSGDLPVYPAAPSLRREIVEMKWAQSGCDSQRSLHVLLMLYSILAISYTIKYFA